jgi:hypothetical protein
MYHRHNMTEILLLWSKKQPPYCITTLMATSGAEGASLEKKLLEKGKDA